MGLEDALSSSLTWLLARGLRFSHMGLTIGLLMVLVLQLGSYKVNDMRGKDRERERQGRREALPLRTYTSSSTLFCSLKVSHAVKPTLNGKGLHKDVNIKRYEPYVVVL